MLNLSRRLSLILMLSFCVPAASLSAQSVNENRELLSNSRLRVQRHDDMFFVNPNVGWVANGFGKVYRTTDSGETWDEIASEGVFMRSIGFANEQKGWVGTFNTTTVLMETNDGSVTGEEG